MKNFLINITRSYKYQCYYEDCFKYLHDTHNIITIIFYKTAGKNPEKIKNKDFINFIQYENTNDLTQKLVKIKNQIWYINTFEERLVTSVNMIKKELGFAVTHRYKIFRNKDLQRKYLSKFFPETTVNFQKISLRGNDEIIIDFPCIIKPTNGVQSSGVAYLENQNDFLQYKKNLLTIEEKLSEKGLQNKSFLLEEFIDGEMYTINYFVNDIGEVFFLPIVKVKSVQELGIDDFANFVRVSKDFQDEIDENEVHNFVKKHIQAFGIKNTFVHHEFKKNSKGKLKTIELNGRIGGYRLELYQENFDINMFDLIMLQKSLIIPPISNYAAFVIYPEKNMIFTGYNDDILDKILNLKSFFSYNTLIKKGKKIGLTKNGYSAIASIKIKHTDTKIFQEDYEYIVKNYKNILKLQ